MSFEPTLTDESKMVVTEFFRRQREEGADSCAALLAQDATWWIQGGAPFCRTFDRQQMLTAFSHISQTFAELRVHGHGIPWRRCSLHPDKFHQ
jgi:ketosteroid isomerase-like protein